MREDNELKTTSREGYQSLEKIFGDTFPTEKNNSTDTSSRMDELVTTAMMIKGMGGINADKYLDTDKPNPRKNPTRTQKKKKKSNRRNKKKSKRNNR